MDKKTVEETVQLDLCTSCGVCKGVCPVNAIELTFKKGQFIPEIDESACIHCERCLHSCPGYEVDFKSFYEKQNQDTPSNIYVGNIIASYVGWTRSALIRREGTSGGLISQMISTLLARNIYQKAFVVIFDKFTGEQAKAQIIQDSEQVLKAAKSKYIPVSIEEIVKYLPHRDEQEKIIVVGTPCQLHGLKKVFSPQQLDNVLLLGLFCQTTLNYNIISYYQDYYSSPGSEVEHFNFRSKEKYGWPGYTKIKTKQGESIFINPRVRINLKPYFTINRCLFCIDKLNQFADISFGDCYSKDGQKKGASHLIVRTPQGRDALDIVRNELYLKEIEEQDILESQRIDLKETNLKFASLLHHNIYPTLSREGGQACKTSLNRMQSQLMLGRSPENFGIIKRKLAKQILIGRTKALVEKIKRLLK